MNETDKQSETGALDQTRFAEESVILPSASAQPPGPVKKTGLTPLKILLVAVPIMFVLFVVSLLSPRGGQNGQGIMASPTPSLEPMTQSEIEKRFAALDADIRAADPTSFRLAFPPVDFTLDLQDATVRRQERR